MTFQTIVDVFVADTQQPLRGLTVSLFDADTFSADDHLGTQTTDSNGRTTFKFEQADFADRFEFIDGGFRRGGATPELYATVTTPKGTIIADTRANGSGRDPFHLSVPIDQTLVAEHELFKHKPRPTKAQLLQNWEVRLREIAGDPDDGESQLCLMRYVLDTMRGLNAPKTDLQKQVVERLKHRVSDADFESVAKIAGSGLDVFDQSQFTDGIDCSAETDPQALAEHLIKTSGTLSSISQALKLAEAPLDANLGTPKAGIPFFHTFDDWDKDCEAAYLDDPDNFPDRETWDEFYPNDLHILVPPEINQIKVRDPHEERIVREADVSTKQLEIVALLADLDVENSTTLAMAVPVDDPTCVINKTDAFDNDNQILAVDVKPGQQIGLYGSGFIADKARWVVERGLWEEIDDEGRLVPEQFFTTVAEWDGSEIDVFGLDQQPDGSNPDTFTGDQVVFNWPEDMTLEGLYRLRLEFRNEDGLITSAENDPTTCELNIERAETVRTLPIYFAILPELRPHNLRVTATDLNCVDETNPELPWPFADDIRYSANALIQRFTVDANGNVGIDTTFEGEGEGGQHWFKDGDTWQPNFLVLPDNAASLPLPLNFDQFLMVPLIAEESDDIDATVIIWIVAIVLLVIVTIIILVVAVIIGLLFKGVGVIPALKVAGSLISALWSYGIPLTQTIVEYVVAELDDVPVGVLVPIFAGDEIAHRLSPVRFHRLLWSIPRSAMATNVTATAFNLNAQTVTEDYRVSALGGTYDFQVLIEA